MNRVVGLLFTIALTVGCGQNENDSQSLAGGKYGGVFSWNETEAVRSIFPLNMTQAAAYRVVAPVYEGLIRFSPEDLSIEPAIGEAWEMKENGRVFEFRIRKGIRFHDDPCFKNGEGRELTAEDVAWCLSRICRKDDRNQMFWLFQDHVLGANEAFNEVTDNGSGSASVAGITAVPDEGVVRIELIHPNPSFLSILGHQGCWIYPKEFIEFYKPEELDLHAVGTGPFRLNKNELDVVTILERNNTYWRTDKDNMPLPYLDAVKVTYEPKVEKELEHFMNGDLTLVEELPLSAKDVLDQQESSDNKYVVSTTPSLTVQFYCLNTTIAPFDDRRVRQAIAMSIDKQYIVDSVLHGQAVAATGGIVPPFFKDYPMVTGLPYNPDSARALLEAAGFPGGTGFPIMSLQFSGNGFGYVDVANAVQMMIKDNLNLRVPISAIPSDQYFEFVETGKAKFWREGWLADHPDPANFLALFYGKNAPNDPNERTYMNTTRFKNERFDSLYIAASHTVDQAQRFALYSEADQVFVNESPAIPLYFTNTTRLVQSYVRGLHHNGMEMLELSEVYFDK